MFKEVKNNYFDEKNRCYCIDAWRTNSHNEEGIVIAKVFINGEVKYRKEEYSTLPEVIAIVNKTISLL